MLYSNMFKGKRGHEGGGIWILVIALVAVAALVLLLYSQGWTFSNFFTKMQNLFSSSNVDDFKSSCTGVTKTQPDFFCKSRAVENLQVTAPNIKPA